MHHLVKGKRWKKQSNFRIIMNKTAYLFKLDRLPEMGVFFRLIHLELEPILLNGWFSRLYHLIRDNWSHIRKTYLNGSGFPSITYFLYVFSNKVWAGERIPVLSFFKNHFCSGSGSSFNISSSYWHISS